LTPLQEVGALELEKSIQLALQADIKITSRQVVSRNDHELLGENWFAVADICRKITDTTILKAWP